MKNICGVMIVFSIVFIAPLDHALAYDSTKVGAAAGAYMGSAASADYFYSHTKCENTDFGFRRSNRRAVDFVYSDIIRFGHLGQKCQGCLKKEFK